MRLGNNVRIFRSTGADDSRTFGIYKQIRVCWCLDFIDFWHLRANHSKYIEKHWSYHKSMEIIRYFEHLWNANVLLLRKTHFFMLLTGIFYKKSHLRTNYTLHTKYSKSRNCAFCIGFIATYCGPQTITPTLPSSNVGILDFSKKWKIHFWRHP